MQPAGGLICPPCTEKLAVVRSPSCRRCGKEVFSDRMEYCMDCSRHPKSFESGAALLNYNEAAQRSMAAMKYKNRREYLDFYSQAMVRRYGKWLANIRPDALVPVPVHPARRRKRGFNQAEELAVRLGVLTEIPVISDLLVRSRKTQPQKNLSPSERLQNLQSAFAISSRWQHYIEEIPQVIVLVDDIYTTGSTMEACTRILKQAGAVRVYTLVICIGAGR